MFNAVQPLNINVAGYQPAINKLNPNDINQVYSVNDLYPYVDHAFSHYEEVLVNTPHVWDWFKERKIDLTHPLISQFRLGFADRTLCKNFGRDKGRQSDIVRGAWQRLGILKPSGYQYFHGDVVFPFLDEDGSIVGAYGRRVSPENRSDRIYYHHWFHGNATFFNLQALGDYNRIILCKSPLEALVLISAGISNVIATMGLFSFTHKHLNLLEKYQPSGVVLAFDNSDSGNHVSGLVAQALSSVNVPTSRLLLPRNNDIGEFVQHTGDCFDSLRTLVDEALPFKQTYENIIGRV